MHGTLMPRASSIDAAKSDGVQVTLRSKTFNSASKLKAIRHQYQARVDFWEKFEAQG
jgi:hypothetical protein